MCGSFPSTDLHAHGYKHQKTVPFILLNQWLSNKMSEKSTACVASCLLGESGTISRWSGSASCSKPGRTQIQFQSNSLLWKFCYYEICICLYRLANMPISFTKYLYGSFLSTSSFLLQILCLQPDIILTHAVVTL